MAKTSTYRMEEYVWFRVTPELEGCPVPFYLGRGLALNEQYHSLTNWQAPMPNHGVLKICLSDGGIFGSNADGEVKLHPGQALVRIFGERDVWDRYDPDHTGPWEFLGLIFRGTAAITMLRGLIERFGRVMTFPIHGSVMHRLESIVSDPSHHFDIAAPDAARMVTDVLMALAEHSEESRTVSGSDRLVHEAVRTIQQRLEDNLTVGDLADIHGVSREHLTRSFRQTLGRTPARMITEEKMGEACRLLRHTKLPIKTVMRNVGYTSNTTFFRAFRQVVGVTPGKFRDRGRELATGHFADDASSGVSSDLQS